jgi:hypothetical protein
MIDFLMIPPYPEVIDPKISGNPKMIDDSLELLMAVTYQQL